MLKDEIQKLESRIRSIQNALDASRRYEKDTELEGALKSAQLQLLDLKKLTPNTVQEYNTKWGENVDIWPSYTRGYCSASYASFYTSLFTHDFVITEKPDFEQRVIGIFKTPFKMQDLQIVHILRKFKGDMQDEARQRLEQRLKNMKIPYCVHNAFPSFHKLIDLRDI